MFSALTQRAAATTLDALARGATDYVTKPAGTGSREASIEQVRTQLIPKIKALGAPREQRTPVRAGSEPKPGCVKPAPAGGRIDIVAVGSSTGGPNALAELFKGIPATFQAPIVIAQHMPPLFTQLLAERLTAHCPLEFREAKDGDLLAPGLAYIAPGDHHMRVVRDGNTVRIALDKEAPENSCRPAVDVLFRSVAAACGSRSLAVVLTGMGQDGLRGCEMIDARGGQIIVQDEASSVVWGMPGFVARAGLAQKILPLDAIAGEILRRVTGTRGQEPGLSWERHHAG
jgi:two-component system chemotaxis response regulator CheB